MNWKDEVTAKLRRYPIMASAAKTIPVELQHLQQEAGSIRSAQAGMRGSRSVRAYEDRLLNIAVKQQELENLLDSTERWLHFMDAALEKLPDWEQRVLALLYKEQMPAVQVSQALGMERSSLYRHRDIALRDLTLTMYGVLES